MVPWITGRLPERTEADPSGNVVLLAHGFLKVINYGFIGQSDTWLPYSPPPQPWQQPRKVPREIVQAFYSPCDKLTALADDGTLWIRDYGMWEQITLPDRDEP